MLNWHGGFSNAPQLYPFLEPSSSVEVQITENPLKSKKKLFKFASKENIYIIVDYHIHAIQSKYQGNFWIFQKNMVYPNIIYETTFKFHEKR